MALPSDRVTGEGVTATRSSDFETLQLHLVQYIASSL
jgi:hypothetical protein